MLKKEIVIYYFSGTGNTKKLVEHFSKSLIVKGYIVTLLAMEDCHTVAVSKGGSMGLVFPVAIQSTFPLVWNFVNDLPEGEGVDVFMFDTMEAYSGGIVGPMRRVLSQKGYNCIASKEFKMSSSINTRKSKVIKGRQKNDQAMEEIEKFTENLINGKTKWRRIPLFSDLMRSISAKRTIWTKMSEKLSVSGDCIKCLRCVKNCPVSAINIVDEIIVINHNKCNVCMRCVFLCPQNAILLGGEKVLFS